MIIDAHIHLWNRMCGHERGVERRSLNWGRARQGDRIIYVTPPSFEDSLSTYERALAHMDWLGIERAVVLQEFVDGNQDDYLARVRQVWPGRFSCTALFERHYYDAPLREFERAIEHNRLQGFLVRTPDIIPEIAVPALIPLWQACAERGLPIVLKNGDPADVRRLVQAAPQLKVVLSHFGGVIAAEEQYRERLQIAADAENITLDSGALTLRQPYPFAQAKERLHEAVERLGAHKIAWGSDYPRPPLVADASYKQQLEFITVECDFLSQEQREQILGQTALRVYAWDA
jgi:predicted TIM-barrel fold metal-dependent hydrolase